MDWLACALPADGEEQSSMVFEQIEHRVPTCGLRDSVGEAKRRANEMGVSICAVINEENVLLGVVESNEWKTDRAIPVEQVMKPAPSTLRPSASVKHATELIAKHSLAAILITTSDGKLLGIFKRQETPAEKKQVPKPEIWA